MNWDAIGAVAELIGASAVFISLIYLATQIKNSKRADQITAATQAAAAVDEWIGQIVRNGELHDLYRRGLTDYESLDRDEKGRFAMLIVQFMRSLEIIWFHRQMDAIESGYWLSLEVTVVRVIGTTGGTRIFERFRDSLSPDFAEVLHDILKRNEAKRGSAVS